MISSNRIEYLRMPLVYFTGGLGATEKANREDFYGIFRSLLSDIGHQDEFGSNVGR